MYCCGGVQGVSRDEAVIAIEQTAGQIQNLRPHRDYNRDDLSGKIVDLPAVGPATD